MIFANAKGKYSYITASATAKTVWYNEGVQIESGLNGKSIITTEFEEPSAKIILFGVSAQNFVH